MATALKNEEIESYRKILVALQARLRGDLDQMTDEVLNKSGGEAAGNLSSMPMHMADLGTENFDQDFTLGLIENEQETLGQIHDALIRIDQGTFGKCEECGETISRSRLQAIPYTPSCIECARKRENA
ncbi:MAG TPA: TraR/DksA family transcriptional regulator [Isosphaeraceae bacterium]|nr:TraR/DksA family transcriptional regulator [Isosphaeraceae bacterium]